MLTLYNDLKIDAILADLERGEWRAWYSPAVHRTASYEEAFFGYFFLHHNILFTREHIIDRYPVDYAVPYKRIAIEIDAPGVRSRGGRKSKKTKARIKDEYLQRKGWTVFRYCWFRHSFEHNLERTLNQLNQLLQLIKGNNYA